MARDIYKTVTDSIVNLIELGEGKSWEMPWHKISTIPRNAESGNDYSGSNIVALWAAAAANEFTSQVWATYKQWQELGAQVKKKRDDQETAYILIYKQYMKKNKTTGDEEAKHFAGAKAVFNLEQVEGYDDPNVLDDNHFVDIDRLEQWVASTGIKVMTGNIAAYYPSRDHVEMPPKANFKELRGTSAMENYYRVLLHELVHASGNKARLNRSTVYSGGDTATYAEEELVAELGAAMLCCQFGIASGAREDHAAYISSWLKKLKSDKKYLFNAVSEATKAVEYLNDLVEKSCEAIAA